MSIFDIGEAVDLLTVLDNREWRSRLQDKLRVTNSDKIVISAKLNIPDLILIDEIGMTDINDVRKETQDD